VSKCVIIEGVFALPQISFSLFITLSCAVLFANLVSLLEVVTDLERVMN